MKKNRINFFAPFKLLLKYEPKYWIFSVSLMIVNGILPIIYIYIPKLFIEMLMASRPFRQMLSAVLLYAGVVFVLNMLNTFLAGKITYCIDDFLLKLKNQIGNTVMSLGYDQIECGEIKNTVILAGNADTIASCVNAFQDIFSGIISIVGLMYIIFQLDWLLILIVIFTVSCKIVFIGLENKFNKKQRMKYADNNRKGDYLTDLLYFNNEAAKEFRLNNIQPWFLNKIWDWRNEMLLLQYKDFKLHHMLELISLVITTVQSAVVLLSLGYRYTFGLLTIANFTLYYSTINELTSSLMMITQKIGSYKQQMISLKDYHKLMELGENNSIAYKNACDNETDFSLNSTYYIDFNHVCFTYPNTENQVINNLSLHINAGEKLVLVGENGSGKTTFVKLLCKLYHPTSGTITVNGKDIWTIPNEEYFSILSVVFQDFANFSFNIAENVACTSDNISSDRVHTAVNNAGLHDVIKNLPNGINTSITRLFDENGIELSGGENQKLAIARALYKNCPIIILDEPTASLDPKSEAEIYQKFYDISAKKTTIFISHRLAISAIADKIAVFSNGEIIEYGNHKELIGQKSLYYKMYTAQKKLYE